ncbi:MAG: PAS domain S-box protein, partial [Acidobacteriota bacterium]|nr:PAS domain S-box protein [Acidobacteriota bacterium]
MKTKFLQSSTNRFPLFLLSVAIFMMGAIFIWFIRHLSGYDNVQSVVAHQYSGWQVMAVFFIFNIVIGIWLATIRFFQKSQETSLAKNTQINRTKEALQQSEARFRELFENANDLIYTTDFQGCFTSINKVGEDITGYTKDELCKMSFTEVVIPEYHKLARRIPAIEPKRDVSATYEIEIITKTGNRVALDISSRLIYEADEPIGVQGIGRDITARKRAEETLRESEARYRVVTESASDAIITIDQEQTILFVNSAAEKIFGYAADEMLGNKLSMLIPEHLRGAHAAGMKRYAATNKRNIPWQGAELPGLHKDGYEVPLEITFGEIYSNGKHLFTAVLRDITERKRNKEELQKNLSLLTSTFEATADGILVVDRDNRIVTFNQRFVEMWQIPDEIIDSKDNARAVDYVLKQLINADDFANTTNYLIVNPENKHFDLLKFKDGKVYERYSHPQILDGKVVGRVLSFRDTTERKRGEELIRQSEEKYRNILETIEEGYFEADLEGVFTFYNKALGNVLGYDADELLGMPYQRYVDRRNAKKLFLAYVKVYRTGQPISELNWEVIREDGTRRFLESSITLIRNAAGVAVGFRGLARDVTHRRQTEAALRESENKYRLLIESTSEGLLQVDTNDRTQFINDRFCEMVGYSAEELINKNWTQMLLDDEGRDLIGQANERRRNGISDRYEIQLKKKSGEMLWVIVGGAPTLNAKGIVIGSMGVFTDITASKKVEEVLKAGETMQRQLAERQSAILDALPAHICLLDQSGKILEVNNEWKQFALENGYSGVNYGVGSNYLGMCDNANGECGEGARQTADACRAVLSGESSHFEMEYPCHSPNEKRWFKLTVTPLHKEKSGGAVVMHLNISERKRIEEQLLHDAFHDGLTGLANRTLFTDHLQMTIERTKRDRSELFAVLFLDFDRFKVINDSL